MNTIAINYAQCIKQSTNWGYDKFYNICEGGYTVVPWGGMDYILPVVMLGVLFTLTITFGLAAYASYKFEKKQSEYFNKLPF